VVGAFVPMNHLPGKSREQYLWLIHAEFDWPKRDFKVGTIGVVIRFIGIEGGSRGRPVGQSSEVPSAFAAQRRSTALSEDSS